MSRNVEEVLARAKEAIEGSGQSDVLEKVFLRNLRCLLDGDTGRIRSSELASVGELKTLNEIARYKDAGNQCLDQVIVAKLNGGLGTSMGLERAKSLIPVKGELSFLDITVQQIRSLREASGASIPLLLMNSFRTVEDTLEALPNDFNQGSPIPLSVLQHKVPKLEEESYFPVEWPQDSSLEWCPPGHGDLYSVLLASGVLEKALASGFRYLFVSNSDNLGATFSAELLGYISEHEVPFLMEVAARTEVDRKGGHLARDLEGELVLRERAQIFPEDEEDFQDNDRYGYFNTNSLWIDLKALHAQLSEQDGVLPLPIIMNMKNVNPTDPNSTKVVQLETAMGAALSCFKGAEAICVPRSRFLPVKTTDDLLRMQSDLFEQDAQGCFRGLSDSSLALPVRLDRRYFSTIADFNERFPYGAPSLRDCTGLEVVGDVRFGKGVRCLGSVSLCSKEGEVIQIEDGAVVEGDA